MGKNLWPFGSVYRSKVGGEATFVADRTKFDLPAGTYTFSCAGTFGDGDAPLFLYLADGTRHQAFRIGKNERDASKTFTIEQAATACYFLCNSCKATAGTVSHVQLERGGSATEYESYQSSGGGVR